MQKEESALSAAMAPALPKLDIPVLEKAIADAKAAGVIEKVITKAEAKLAQAKKRAGVIAGAPAKEAAEKDLAAKSSGAIEALDMDELKWAIEAAEAEHVAAVTVDEAKAKLAKAEALAAKEKLEKAMELPDNEREALQAALADAKAKGVDGEALHKAERRLSDAWSV